MKAVLQVTRIVSTPTANGFVARLQTTPVATTIAGIGPQGPAGIALSFTHDQPAPATQWIINHNLGARPVIELFDTGGAEIEAEVVHTSLNQAIAYFNVAVAGTAKCI